MHVTGSVKKRLKIKDQRDVHYEKFYNPFIYVLMGEIPVGFNNCHGGHRAHRDFIMNIDELFL
jgi:hypothetical protein